MDQLKQEVSQAITNYCKENNTLISDLADHLGFSTTTVRYWVNKKNAPTPQNLAVLEEALDVEFEHKKEYALYKGETFLSAGALHEIADDTGLKLELLRDLSTPKKRIRSNQPTKRKKFGYTITKL